MITYHRAYAERREVEPGDAYGMYNSYEDAIKGWNTYIYDDCDVTVLACVNGVWYRVSTYFSKGGNPLYRLVNSPIYPAKWLPLEEILKN
jgi:hypothetical protein